MIVVDKYTENVFPEPIYNLKPQFNNQLLSYSSYNQENDLDTYNSQFSDSDEGDYSIFISNLPAVTKRDLKELFNQDNSVKKIRILHNSRTKRPLGSAYITFNNIKSANMAIHNYNNYLFKNKTIKVEWSKYNEKSDDEEMKMDDDLCKRGIVIKNIKYESIEKVKIEIEKYSNILGVKECVNKITGSFKDSCIIKIANKDKIEEIMENLIGKELDGNKINVSRVISTKIPLKSRLIVSYIKNVPEKKLFQFFSKCGTIISLEKNEKDIIIQYLNESDTINALNSNGMLIDNNLINVKIQGDNNIKTNDDKEDETKLCLNCDNNKAEYVCVPCGHLCACKYCVDEVKESKKCPKCEKDIIDVIKIYF